MAESLRRYIAVVQDPRGYPSASLSDDDAEAPFLYTVVKADEHEAEIKRLREALEWIAHQTGASTCDDAARAMNDAYDAATAALGGDGR